MKTISNLTTTPTCTDDGQPCPKFPQSGNFHGADYSAVISAKGIFIYNPKVPGVGVLLPHDQLKAMAIHHEPKLAPPKPVATT